MKYFVLLCDGAADRKKNEPGFKTPLEAAVKPTFNMLSYRSFNGYISGATAKFRADVDAAHVEALGYDPDALDGLAAFDAASAGVTLEPEDTAYKCTFVSLSEKGEPCAEKELAGCPSDITKEETAKLISALNKGLSTKIKKFHTVSAGLGCLVWKRAPESAALAAPSDIHGAAGGYLPTGSAASRLVPMFEKSFDILKDHPVNVKRRERGLLPLNSLWLWSPSKAPGFEPFAEKWQIGSGTVITRSAALSGAAVLAGMKTLEAPMTDGAEDYALSAKAVTDEFASGADYVMLHTEAVAKAALSGDRDAKIKAIEAVDSLILAPVYEYLCGCGDQFKLLVHTVLPAPYEDKKFADEPAPFFMYNSQRAEVGYKPFSELNAGKGGFRLPDGCGYKFTSFMIRIPAPVEKEETQAEDGQQQ